MSKEKRKKASWNQRRKYLLGLPRVNRKSPLEDRDLVLANTALASEGWFRLCEDGKGEKMQRKFYDLSERTMDRGGQRPLLAFPCPWVEEGILC